MSTFDHTSGTTSDATIERTSPSTGPSSGGPTDGRRRRRERGRTAVTDAMIDLVLEGHVPPSAEQLATRADVSVASVFRYFDGLDDLRRAAAAEYFERFDHLFAIDRVGVGSLAGRVARYVDARIRLYSIAEPIGRLVRVRAHDDPIASDNLDRLRATYTDQIRHHFDVELAPLADEPRTSLVVSIATLTSFESWDQCRHHHGLDNDRIRGVWVAALTALTAVTTVGAGA